MNNSNNTNQSKNNEKSKSKNYWKWGLTVFWVCVVSMNIVFVYLATSKQSKLVNKDYYQMGVEYQKEIDARKVFNKYFPASDLKYSEQTFVLDLKGNAADSVRGKIYRSDNPNYDNQMVLVQDSLGGFKSEKINLPEGPYQVQILLNRQGELAQKEFKIWVN